MPITATAHTKSLATSSSPPEFTDVTGEKFNITMIVITLLMSTVAVTLNALLASFHHKDARKKIVSFIYFMLSVSDLCTGICCFLHSIIFAVLVHGNVKEEIAWLVQPANFLTSVAFKASAFVSVTFAVIRTIKIVFPFYRVNKKAVGRVTLVYTLLWVGVYIAEVAIFVKLRKYGGVVDRLLSRFLDPSKSYLTEHVMRKYGAADLSLDFECIGDSLHTIGPIFVCSLVATIATVIQLVYLWRPSDEQPAYHEERRQATITIILITLLFIVCAGVTLYGPHQVCSNPHLWRDARAFYATGYLPFFINAAMNPIILVIRLVPCREYLVKMFRACITFRRRDSTDNQVTLTTLNGS